MLELLVGGLELLGDQAWSYQFRLPKLCTHASTSNFLVPLATVGRRYNVWHLYYQKHMLWPRIDALQNILGQNSLLEYTQTHITHITQPIY